MNSIFLLSTAFLVAVLVVFSVGTWRLFRGRDKARPIVEYLLMAVVFGPVGSQALTWLAAGHSDASLARQTVVWLQLLAASGSAALMVGCALLAWTRRQRLVSVGLPSN